MLKVHQNDQNFLNNGGLIQNLSVNNKCLFYITKKL